MQSLLTVIAEASSYDLTSLAAAKTELKITNNTQNSEIELLIHQVSGAISKICDRVFAEETVSEVFRFYGTQSWDGRIGGNVKSSLILRRRPISSIVSVTEDDVVVASDEYECDFNSGILYRLTTEDYRRGWSASKITVSYIAGWELLDGLPYEVEKACLLWIKSLWSQMNRKDLSVRVEDVPGLMRKEYFSNSQLSTITKSYDPPPEVMVLLAPYIEKAIR